MPSRSRAALALLPILLLSTATLAGCGDDVVPPAGPAGPSDTGTVHLPTAAAPPTTDSAGHLIEQLPALPAAAMSAARVRSLDYSYAMPVGWSEGERDIDPPPDTIVLPDDTDLPALIAVERPFKADSLSLTEVVDKLRAGFDVKGFAPKAARERDIAGYHAQGIVVDQSPELRHVYYIVVYTEKVFAVRLSYDPATPAALAVYEGVLDSWTWG